MPEKKKKVEDIGISILSSIYLQRQLPIKYETSEYIAPNTIPKIFQ